MFLPNEAGTAVGGPSRSRYVLLEVHLNNPDLKRGENISSGKEKKKNVQIELTLFPWPNNGNKLVQEILLIELPSVLGVEDSSGIRFHVTKHLRRYDSGIMELGLEYTNKMAVPPKQAMFTLPGYCIADCTEIVSTSQKSALNTLDRTDIVST